MFRKYENDYNPKIDFKVVNLINPKHDVINNYLEKVQIFKKNIPFVSEQGRWFTKMKNIYFYLQNNEILTLDTFVYAKNELEMDLDVTKVDFIISNCPKEVDVIEKAVWLLYEIWKTKPIGMYSYVLATLVFNSILKNNHYIPIIFIDSFNSFIERMISEGITKESLYEILANYHDMSMKYVDKYSQSNKQKILDIVNENKEILINLFDVKTFWLFGSFVRDETTEYSDVDLYVDFSKDVNDEAALELKKYLEKIFARRVDMHIEGKTYERMAPNGKETREVILDATK